MDYSLNGIFIDWITSNLGYNTAHLLIILKSKGGILLPVIIFFIPYTISWWLVEKHYLNTLTTTIEKMEHFFEEKETPVVLDKPFTDLELKLNKLMQENIKTSHLAQLEFQRKNDLITYLAHDIRTPLASVIGYLNLLEEIPDLPEEQRIKYTQITLDKAYRLEHLINEFFDITRFNLSSIPLEKEEINLNFMLAQLADEFYPLLEKGKRKVSLQLEENIVVFADADKLARVFSNLLKNAISYSFENSIITITAKNIQQETRIIFSNYGKTIPPHKLNTIFDKFFRLDQSRSTHTGGAGLGLAIAKGIIVQHGGDISANSNEKETIFTVTLPQYKN